MRTCAALLEVELALWALVRHPGVEPTTNRTERALRLVVMWQCLSLDSQSQAGSRFVKRLLVVGMLLLPGSGFALGLFFDFP